MRLAVLVDRVVVCVIVVVIEFSHASFAGWDQDAGVWRLADAVQFSGVVIYTFVRRDRR